MITVWIIIGFCILGIIVGFYLIIKNAYCFKLSQQISQWVFYYQVITERKDIDYDIDCYTSSYCWFNPFICWTKRGMCYDKEKYNKLKKFIDVHKKEIQEMKEKMEVIYGVVI